MMNGPEKSDSAVLAVKPANKAGKPAAEWLERRAGNKGNTGQPRMRRTQSRDSVSQGLDRVLHAARQRKKERFTNAMRVRLEQFSLELHEEKTRLLEFGRHAVARRQKRGVGKPETFTFLGFRFICGRSRRGAFQLQRKTRADRMGPRLRDIKAQLRNRMRHAIPKQGRWLKAVVTGFFAYHAVPTNGRALVPFGTSSPGCGCERCGAGARKVG